MPERAESKPVRRDSAPAGPSSLSLPANRRVQLVEAVKQLVAESSVPVPLPSVAQVLQQEQQAGPDWFGAGTLRDLIEGLDILPLAFSGHGQGFVFDPDRHELPEDSSLRDDFKKADPELFSFALKVSRHTNMPLLTPEHYTALIKVLAEEIGARGFSRVDTVTAVEDRCYDDGLPVAGEQVAFVVESVLRGGLALPKGGAAGSVASEAVRKAFFSRMTEVCRGNNLPLDDVERKLLARWLSHTE